MITEVQITVSPQDFHDEKKLVAAIREKLKTSKNAKIDYCILKKSLDARSRDTKLILKLQVATNEGLPPRPIQYFRARNVSLQEEVHIIGAGPAGLFCALKLIEQNKKPILIERGKNVRDRRRDLAMLNKEGILNEESNYCFGEGGAGTYSDGKLYTRSNKRGSIQQVLDWFYGFGAEENILYESHPHIGTNKLPKIIEAMRKEIIRCGGEVHFNTKLTDINFSNGRIKNITVNNNTVLSVRHVVLATGHSARDVYELLHRKKIQLEAKPFALGVRIEHPQHLIDSMQYHCSIRNEYLPPASYSLVEQVAGRGVFSFCMCPGGIIAPAATEQNTVVVNGWSPSKRNNPYANSGMVVNIEVADYGLKSPLDGLYFQRTIEQKAYTAGGGKFVAPAQRMVDFTQKKISANLPSCSYVPGVHSTSLYDVLPAFVYKSLQQALPLMDYKLRRYNGKGFFTNEAILLATETRTSSPVRVPRVQDTLTHPSCSNLYPCAEGAGYAGGIVSAAMDGINVAISIK